MRRRRNVVLAPNGARVIFRHPWQAVMAAHDWYIAPALHEVMRSLGVLETIRSLAARKRATTEGE